MPGRTHFSIHCEFRVSLDQIKKCTNLVNSDSDSMRIRLRSIVSPDSFALACHHLSGENITVSESTASDLKLLAAELKCPSLQNILNNFKMEPKRILSGTVDEMERSVRDFQSEVLPMSEEVRLIHDECLELDNRMLETYRMFCNGTYDDSESLIDDIDMSGTMQCNDLKCLKEKLSSLRSDIEMTQTNWNRSVQFESHLKEDVVRLLSESSTEECVNEFVRSKAEFGDAWCQHRLGKRAENCGLGKYRSMASLGARVPEKSKPRRGLQRSSTTASMNGNRYHVLDCE